MLGIISVLSTIAPIIGQWVSGDDGEKAAVEIANLAKTVTGSNDAQAAVDAIIADPNLQLEFQKTVEQNKHRLDELYLADRQDARKMYKKTEHKQADRIAEGVMKWNMVHAILIALAQIIALSYFTALPVAVVVVIGNVSGWIIKGALDERKDVIGFYFGSSVEREVK